MPFALKNARKGLNRIPQITCKKKPDLDSMNTNIAIINPGSATIKLALFEDSKSIDSLSQTLSIKSIPSLIKSETLTKASNVIIRFVHGGAQYQSPVILNDHVINNLSAFNDLAPIHNKHSLNCAELIHKHFPDKRIIAVFDTEFFRHLPLVSKTYALPKELIKKYNIRRYGFHGFAHASMLAQANSRLSTASKIITMQLGSGCSMAAVKDKQVVDTSMGFTPTEGLLMSTRSGDLDPGLLLWLQKQEGWSADDAMNVINTQSGWSGLTGLGDNFQHILESDTSEAELAVELFKHQIRKTIGAYFAILGGLDIICLSGGIAENSLDICTDIFQPLKHLGISVEPIQEDKHQKESKAVQLISTPSSSVSVLLCPNNEFKSMLESVNASRLLENSDNLSE